MLPYQETGKSKSLKCASLPSSQIFWASVQKAMFGSSKWKRAQDFERKFGPWKQASVIWLPCKLIDPPNCIPSSGNGIWNKEMWHPDTTFSTPGQCRWCAASSTAREPNSACPSCCRAQPDRQWREPVGSRARVRRKPPPTPITVTRKLMNSLGKDAAQGRTQQKRSSLLATLIISTAGMTHKFYIVLTAALWAAASIWILSEWSRGGVKRNKWPQVLEIKHGPLILSTFFFLLFCTLAPQTWGLGTISTALDLVWKAGSDALQHLQCGSLHLSKIPMYFRRKVTCEKHCFLFEKH